MSSSTRIDGSLPAPGDSPSTGIVFSGGWAVEYDWVADRAQISRQPARLATLGFPPPLDSDLEGALRGQRTFAQFLYLFKAGQYLRLDQGTMVPTGPPVNTASAWDLPSNWTDLDAVFPGGGKKSGFAYFFRGDEYCRFDWATNKRSPNYPKKIAPEWHLPAGFDRDFDGAIIGQAGFSTKAYLFKTVAATVNNDGQPVPAGTPNSKLVRCPVYARYDFNTEVTEFSVTNPFDVVTKWNGLFPLLDAGPAIDTALTWCNGALASLTTGVAPAAAFTHHFMTPSPTPAQVSAITTQMTAVRDRIKNIPDRFQYTPGLGFAAQTSQNTLTEIGDLFSTRRGPNGRAAVMIHEAVHFTFTGGAAVDVPEWSGEVVNGVPMVVDSASNRVYHTISTAEAITNPSSYASFAQEVTLPQGDTRFGAGRPQE